MFSSDWPAVTLNMNPFEGIETAVTRQPLKINDYVQGWNDKDLITVE